MKKRLTIRLALLILCAFSMNTAFAQDVRQKPVVKKQTTTTTTKQPAASTKKGTTTGNKNTTASKPSTSNSSIMTIRVGNVSFRMICVDGGTFMMGATSEQGSDAYDNEKPAHSVTLSTYYIGETEVTQELWQEVMGSNPSNFKGKRRPVEMVSWEDCQDFIRRLNQRTGKKFRLPTEAEWEYAARGGKKSNGYKYAGGNSVYDVAWYENNRGSDTHHPVAQKRANELGLYDMSGNVWEWCQDWENRYSSFSQTNPTGPSSGKYRMLRGGGWDNQAGYCRLPIRSSSMTWRKESYYGFRLAH